MVAAETAHIYALGHLGCKGRKLGVSGSQNLLVQLPGQCRGGRDRQTSLPPFPALIPLFCP